LKKLAKEKWVWKKKKRITRNARVSVIWGVSAGIRASEVKKAKYSNWPGTLEKKVVKSHTRKTTASAARSLGGEAEGKGSQA